MDREELGLPPREEPTEYFFGEWVSVEAFVEALNEMIGPSRSTLTVHEHSAGILYLTVPFREEGQ
jgi:hypothetical protein